MVMVYCYQSGNQGTRRKPLTLKYGISGFSGQMKVSRILFSGVDRLRVCSHGCFSTQKMLKESGGFRQFCLGRLTRNWCQNSDVSLFFFLQCGFEIHGVVHIVNYTADFPSKWMGCGMQSDIDAEFPCGVHGQFHVKIRAYTYPTRAICDKLFFNHLPCTSGKCLVGAM